MADQQGTTRHVANASNWRAVCTMPDYCKVGNAIVGFDSFAILSQNTLASPNVKGQGLPVYRVGDYFRQIQTDAGQHIISGTSLGSGYVKLLDGQNNVKVNGIPVARHDSRCLINCDASGNGGTPGKIVTESKTVASTSVLKQIKEESGNVLTKKWESLKDSAKTLWDAFGTDPAGSAARQKIFNGVVDTMHGLSTLAGPDPYAIQGAYISGDPASVALIEQLQREQLQAVNSINDHIKQSWNQAYARNGPAGASAMVLTSLGLEIAGNKGLGAVGSIAGEISEIVRLAKTPLEAVTRLDKEIEAARSAGKSAEEIGLLQKARDERLAQVAKETHQAEEAAKPAEGVHVKQGRGSLENTEIDLQALRKQYGVNEEKLQVEATFQHNDDVFYDVNQTARNPALASDEKLPIYSESKALAGAPNQTFASAHAEIGSMGQSFAKGNLGGDAILNIYGKDACSFCLYDVRKWGFNFSWTH